MNRKQIILVLGALIASTLFGGNDEDTDLRRRNQLVVGRTTRLNSRKHGGNSDMLVLPGIVADRKRQSVILQAEATGIGPNQPVEFVLIAEDSAHDYESIAISFARPSAVHKALTFIGLAPGRPVAPEALRFHPKGERVFVTVSLPSHPEFLPVRVEQLILDTGAGKTLDNAGLVFTGSKQLEGEEAGQVKGYAADFAGPRSIASNYNEPTTVLDVPRQAPQSDVYHTQSANPVYCFEKGELLNFELKPEYTDGRKRVLDIGLALGVRDGTAGSKLEEIVFSLAFGDGRPSLKTGLNGALKVFTGVVEKGQDPFVTVAFDPGLSLDAIRQACMILSTIETDSGIRIEPPPEGQLYYRAYIPDESYRDRNKRIAQPWELHLRREEGGVTGMLTQIEQKWRDDRVRPDLDISHYAVPTPAALRKALDEEGPGMRVILVFVPQALTQGELMEFLAPVLSTHPTVHVFMKQPAA